MSYTHFKALLMELEIKIEYEFNRTLIAREYADQEMIENVHRMNPLSIVKEPKKPPRVTMEALESLGMLGGK